MKRLFSICILLILSTILLTACGKGSSEVEDVAEQEDEKLQVFCSVNSVYDFVNKIGGDKIDTHIIIPVGADEHDWEPSPQDAIDLETADIIFYNGAGLEPWIPMLQMNLKNDDVIYVDLSQNVELIEVNGVVDPHIWLNPQNVKIEMRTITDTLVEEDPANAQYYEENYDLMAEKIDILDQKYKDELSDINSDIVIVSQGAFAYLCDAYGLEQIVIAGNSENSEPSTQNMAYIIDTIKLNDVKAIFYSDSSGKQITDTIVAETGVRAYPLNSFEGNMEQSLGGENEYFAVMESNLDSLTLALK